METTIKCLNELGYNVKIGNVSKCRYVKDVLTKLEKTAELCIKYPKLMFLFIGDCSLNIIQAFNLDTNADTKTNFFLFFTDNYIYGDFKYFDTSKKLLMSINNVNEGCCICLSNVEEEHKRIIICMTCLCRCCVNCANQLHTDKCPLCRTIIGRNMY